ncbi:MAG: tRNA (guanosine(37)-N1)-methyltransferase TrmD [Rhabdochlamydiaceae bacterium]
MRIDVLSLFPEYFTSPLEVSMIKRAIDKQLLDINLVDIRSYANDKHRRVDDRPFGGGPGMVLKPEPVSRAIRDCRKSDSKVIYLSPQGRLLKARDCAELAKLSHLILVCGHYEGLDERVIEKDIDEEISIGDYVLTNGCLAALVVIDSVMRFISGVLGHEEGAQKDSFQNGLFDSPHYTKPVDFEGMVVPEVLRNGNHAEIQMWRDGQALNKTKKVRPDLVLEIEKRKKEII